MIFALPLRTRGTECGPDRWVTLPAIISYMEHCRWEWLRVPGLGLSEAVREGHGFYVLNQSIAMSRRFGQGQQSQVRCVLRFIGRTVAKGEQDVVRDDGTLLAHCSIRGAWIDPIGRLARIPLQAKESISDLPLVSEQGEPDAGDPDSLFDPPQPLRPATPELTIADDPPEDANCRVVAVRATDCDIFEHVNAANYVRFVADSLALQGASSSLYRAELKYMGQARFADQVEVRTWPLGNDCWGATISRGDEQLFRAAVQTEPSA